MYQTMSWNYYDFPARFMEGWPWESCYFHFTRGIRLANEKIPTRLSSSLFRSSGTRLKWGQPYQTSSINLV